MSKLFSLLSLSIVTLAFVACSSSSDDKKSGATTPKADQFLGTYEANDGCTTGRQTFTGATEEEIGKAFCEGLKDESRNKSCASEQRQQIFAASQCPGEFTSHDSSGFTSVFTKNYAFQENECGTGVHFFAASTEEAADLMYCKGLKDDELNRNCAKSKRDEKAADLKCDEILKVEVVAKPEVKKTEKSVEKSTDKSTETKQLPTKKLKTKS